MLRHFLGEARLIEVLSWKPIVNVRTGWRLCACIKATMVEESMPPLRKAPSGTSETMRNARRIRRRGLQLADRFLLGLPRYGS